MRHPALGRGCLSIGQQQESVLPPPGSVAPCYIQYTCKNPVAGPRQLGRAHCVRRPQPHTSI